MILGTFESEFAAIMAHALSHVPDGDEAHLVVGYGLHDSAMIVTAFKSKGAAVGGDELASELNFSAISADIGKLADRARVTLASAGSDLPTKWWMRYTPDSNMLSRGEYGTPQDLRGAPGKAIAEQWGSAIMEDDRK